MPLLFAYGTLCSEKVQRMLFGKTLQSTDYILNDQTVCRCVDGFYTVKPKQGCAVTGKMLRISDEDMLVADEWELVPLYEKKQMKDNGRAFFVYIRSDMADIVEEGALGISDHEEDDLLEIVRDFMAQRHSL